MKIGDLFIAGTLDRRVKRSNRNNECFEVKLYIYTGEKYTMVRHCLDKVSMEDSTMENVDFLLAINRVSDVSSPSRQSICRLSNMSYMSYIHTLNYLRSHQLRRVGSCHLVLQLRVCH